MRKMIFILLAVVTTGICNAQKDVGKYNPDIGKTTELVMKSDFVMPDFISSEMLDVPAVAEITEMLPVINQNVINQHFPLVYRDPEYGLCTFLNYELPADKYTLPILNTVRHVFS